MATTNAVTGKGNKNTFKGVMAPPKKGKLYNAVKTGATMAMGVATAIPRALGKVIKGQGMDMGDEGGGVLKKLNKAKGVPSSAKMPRKSTWKERKASLPESEQFSGVRKPNTKMTWKGVKNAVKNSYDAVVKEHNRYPSNAEIAKNAERDRLGANYGVKAPAKKKNIMGDWKKMIQ